MQGKSALNIVKKYHPTVTKVMDAKKTITVAVTAADCKKSTAKSPNSCAMAKACERTFDGAIISLNTAYVVKGNTAYRYVVPQSVAREIVSFDRNHEFSPGEYSLKAPSASQKLGPRKYALKPERHDVAYPKVKRRNHKTTGIRSI